MTRSDAARWVPGQLVVEGGERWRVLAVRDGVAAIASETDAACLLRARDDLGIMPAVRVHLVRVDEWVRR